MSIEALFALITHEMENKGAKLKIILELIVDLGIEIWELRFGIKNRHSK